MIELQDNQHFCAESDTKQDVLALYSQLMHLPGRRYPRSYIEAPQQLFLPQEVFGDMELATLRTSETGNEYSQTVAYADGIYHYSPMRLGNSRNVGGKAHRAYMLNSYLGRKKLFEYHCHPPVGATSLASDTDLKAYIAHPNSAFLHGIGSLQSFTVYAQLEEAAKIPVSSFIRNLTLPEEMLAFNRASQARHIVNYGYVMYIWTPPTEIYSYPIDSQGTLVHVTELRPGDLAQGITLKKVAITST